jgi:parallel beta-helix repeat protein
VKDWLNLSQVAFGLHFNPKFMKVFLTIIALFCFVVAYPQKDIQKKFQTLLIDVEDGGTVDLPAGHFFFDASLSMDGKSNIIIRGAGRDKTILSFKGQVTGAEGIKITNGQNIAIENLSVHDSKGDGIKTQLVDGITFRNVAISWTGGADEKNGGYGLYPVQCSNVLIEKCTVSGASDAGIYVGQSKHIIVRNSVAFENVAGIEIENSMYADVYENEAFNNTGGVLIFDLPDLTVKEGGFVRVFNNNIHDNNHLNFAPKGNIVGKVPQGTGLMILATRNVEVFDNKIVNNITASTAIVSYYMTENPIKDATYKPFPSSIFIHDNHYERPRVKATSKGRLGKMYKYKLRFGKNVPHIIFDGIEDDKMKDRMICLKNNTNGTFVNIDAGNKFKNKTRDAKPHECEQTPLSPVQLTSSKI